jgi:hypothetical protein
MHAAVKQHQHAVVADPALVPAVETCLKDIQALAAGAVQSYPVFVENAAI